MCATASGLRPVHGISRIIMTIGGGAPTRFFAESVTLYLMNVPFRNSSIACCSSAFVFITIGPYHATGS